MVFEGGGREDDDDDDDDNVDDTNSLKLTKRHRFAEFFLSMH